VAVYTRTATCCPIRSEEGVTGVLTPPNSSTRFRDLSPEQQIGGYPRAGQLSGIVDDVTLDSEGRCIILEFPAFVLLGIYSPANRDESRDEFRIGFLEALDVRIRNLVAEGKQVILTGDLNVIRDEIDSANLVDHLKKAEITVEKFLSTASRRLFNHLVFDGRVFGARDEGRDKPVLWDLCRLYHPKRKGMFTCWDTKKNLRPANNGSRIDYVLCSDGIRSWFSDADIQEGLIGSDHCPIFARLKDWVMVDGVEKSILDVMNPEGMFKGGERLREWSTKDLLPSSAKLIPEFDRRRNIKDMFTTKHTPMSRPQTSIPSPAAVGSASRSSGPATVLTDPQVQSGMSAATPTKTTNQVSQGPKSPQDPPKRLAPSPKVSKFQKKAKVAQPVGPGQSTLKSFFQPKASLTAPSAPATPRDLPPVAGTSTVRNQDDDTYGNIEHATRRITDMPLEDDTVFDPIANKDSWSKLMKKRLPPRCEHDERCITLTTKKPGVNNGMYSSSLSFELWSGEL